MTTTGRRLRRSLMAVGLASLGIAATPALAGATPALPERTVVPGGSFTLSGDGCAVDGGRVGITLSPGEDVPPVVGEVILPGGAVAGDDGTWSVTATFPTGLSGDAYVALPFCMSNDGTAGGPLKRHAVLIHVDRGPDTPPGTGPAPAPEEEVPTPEPVTRDRPTTPRPVKARPRFTG